MTYWFDMDGTIADLYAVSGWLDMLMIESVKPYAEAKPLVNMARLARAIHKAQRKGYKVGIISWTSKNGTVEYNKAVANTKREWLARHLPSVEWDAINVVEYGTCKKAVCGNGVLFDDEERNRKEWGEGAYLPSEIFAVLR